MTAQFVCAFFPFVKRNLQLTLVPDPFFPQEHTILLRPTVKEVVSRGDDY
jgi:hypothetical protein